MLIIIFGSIHPVVLLSIFAFHCPPMWSHDENVDCPHLYHVIMGSYTLIFGVLKYFLIFGGFVRFDSYPLGLLSYGAFVHFCFSLSAHVIAWRECWLSKLVSGDHGIVHLDCWSIKMFSHFGGFCTLWCWSCGSFILWYFCPFLLFTVRPCDHMMRMLIVHSCIMWSWDRTPWFLEYKNNFLFWGVFVRLDSDPLGLSSYGAFVHFCFPLSAHVISWRECWFSTPVSGDHGIVHLDFWSLKIFSYFGGFCLLWFWSFWFFRPISLLLSIFAFLCPPMWSHDENVDCPHLYRVIMGSYTLIFGVLKYFLILGGFVRFDSDPLGLSSFGAFVHFCFSLSAHVITWRECWWSTPQSCDHGIVHLDCWSIKIFSHFGGFCPALILILWGFCPMVLLLEY